MYESFFGLARRPFAASPDPDNFVAVDTARDALAELAQCAEGGRGIGILTAPAGMGKSLLCRKLVERLAPAFSAILLPNANFPTRRSLLQSVLYELGHPYIRMDEQELRLELTTAVKQARQNVGAVVLVIDEAHLLSPRLLEEVRSLMNLVEGGEPLARVILSGQLLLEEKLASGDLEAFNQRIACQVTLAPLSRRESSEYVLARIQSAGGDISGIFTPDAMELIVHASDGVPRCLNQLCDHSLLLGYASDTRPVGSDLVREALEDLKQLPLHWNEPSAVRGSHDIESPRAEQAGSPSSAHSCRPSASPLPPARPIADSVETVEIGGDSVERGVVRTPQNTAISRELQSAENNSRGEAAAGKPAERPVFAVIEVGGGDAPPAPSTGQKPLVTAAHDAFTETDSGVEHQPAGTAPAARTVPQPTAEQTGTPAGTTSGDDHAEAESRADDLGGDTYRLIQQQQSGSIAPIWEAPVAPVRKFARLSEFEEELVEDRYAELDAGRHLHNPAENQSTPLEPPLEPARSIKRSPQHDDPHTADEDEVRHTATETFMPAATGGNDAVEHWTAAADPADLGVSPGLTPDQIIDQMVPLLNEALDGVSQSPASGQATTETCLEEHWEINEGVVSLPIGLVRQQPEAGKEASSDPAGDSDISACDLDMPAELMSLEFDTDDVSEPRDAGNDDDPDGEFETVILDAWSHATETQPSTAAALNRNIPGVGAAEPPAAQPLDLDTGFVETGRFDVVQPEYEDPTATAAPPAQETRTGDQGPAAPSSGARSSSPQGRYSRLFSDLRRHSNRPA